MGGRGGGKGRLVNSTFEGIPQISFTNAAPWQVRREHVSRREMLNVSDWQLELAWALGSRSIPGLELIR
jgi:hypothetical protein